jgi:PAS domain S-box-containing protein
MVGSNKTCPQQIAADAMASRSRQGMNAVGEVLLRRVVETATDAIVVIDEDQRIVLFNSAAERMFGRSRQSAEGTSIVELLPQRFRHGHSDRVRRFGEDRQQPRMMSPERLVVGLRGNGEEFPIEASISASEVHGRRFYAAILRDVTERERNRAALMQSNLDLQQFAFAASHDMRSPLRSVSGYLGLLDSRHAGALAPAAREMITRCIAAVGQLDRLTEELLSFARISADPIEPVEVDCNSALAESLRLLEHSVLETGATIEASELPSIRVDRHQLVRLFQNLLDNAIKYSRGRRPQIKVGASRRNAEWVLSVADNGIGIDKQFHQRIFETFKRLHTQQEFPGTGMGLAMCRRIADRLGGTIWVESEPGQGSTFFFTIPDPHDPDPTTP